MVSFNYQADTVYEPLAGKECECEVDQDCNCGAVLWSQIMIDTLNRYEIEGLEFELNADDEFQITLERMFVDHKYRNKGIATRFMKYLVTQADDNVVTLRLEICPEDSMGYDELFDFYTRFGFVGDRSDENHEMFRYN